MTNPIIISNLLSFDADNFQFTGEISTIEGNLGALNLRAPMRVRSAKTGKVVEFLFVRRLEDDGEVMGWAYKVAPNQGTLSGLKLVIYND